jgi:hypothetical protein
VAPKAERSPAFPAVSAQAGGDHDDEAILAAAAADAAVSAEASSASSRVASKAEMAPEELAASNQHQASALEALVTAGAGGQVLADASAAATSLTDESGSCHVDGPADATSATSPATKRVPALAGADNASGAAGDTADADTGAADASAECGLAERKVNE